VCCGTVLKSVDGTAILKRIGVHHWLKRRSTREERKPVTRNDDDDNNNNNNNNKVWGYILGKIPVVLL
jgi:hypothetical protein